jgi:hypothetical protein
MIKSLSFIALTAIAIVSVPPSAFAEKNHPMLRNKRQNARIAEGVKSGEITHGEAKKLGHEEHRIHRAERRAGRDGVVTEKEANHIDHMQDKASADIYRAKHNDRERPKAEGAPAGGAEAPTEAPAPSTGQ